MYIHAFIHTDSSSIVVYGVRPGEQPESSGERRREIVSI